MSFLECDKFSLSLFVDQALAVKLAIGSGMSLAAWRKKVGRDITDARHVGNDFDFLFDFRKLGEKFGVGVAFDDLFGDRATIFERFLKSFHVGFVQKDLCLHRFGG